jgi:NitT/TauT family transport system permease protein
MSEIRPARRSWFHAASFKRALPVISPVIVPGLRALSARVHLVDTRFFSSPSSILLVGGEMLHTGELVGHIGVSLQRIAIGFIVGAVPGVLIGLVVGLVPIVRALIQPLVDCTFPIPKVALLPLFILMFGIGEASKYAVIATAVIYLVLINTAAGVRNIDRIYLDVAANFHASKRMMLSDIAVPGALPAIMTGLRLGMAVALIVIVTAEFMGARSGVGYLIWTSWQIFQVEKMYLGLLVIGLLGVFGAMLLDRLERLLIPWKVA